MARLEMTTFAQSVSVDRDRGALSIFHLVDGLTIKGDTSDPPADQTHRLGNAVVVITFWRRSNPAEPESATGRLRLFGPRNKKLIGGGEFKIDLSNARRSQALMNLPFMPYQGPGEYKFIVELKIDDDKWKRAGERDFVIDKAP